MGKNQLNLTIEQDPARAEIMLDLQRIVDELNAQEPTFPQMRMTQVGSSTWLAYMKKMGKAIDEPMDGSSPPDWDLRIEPVRDDITLSIIHMQAYVSRLIKKLGLSLEAEFKLFFNVNWRGADLSVQCRQIKPLSNFDMNVDWEGHCLFDDSLFLMEQTHHGLFLLFIEQQQIITPHIYAMLALLKNTLMKGGYPEYIEDSLFRFLIKSYFRPLRMGMRFHIDTVIAWVEFIHDPITQPYYQHVKKEWEEKYAQGFNQFESALSNPYCHEKWLRLKGMHEQLNHDFELYCQLATEMGEALHLKMPEPAWEGYSLTVVQWIRLEKTFIEFQGQLSTLLAALQTKQTQQEDEKKKNKANTSAGSSSLQSPTVKKEKNKMVCEEEMVLPPVNSDDLEVHNILWTFRRTIALHLRIMSSSSSSQSMDPYHAIWVRLFKSNSALYQMLKPEQQSTLLAGLIRLFTDEEDHFESFSSPQRKHMFAYYSEYYMSGSELDRLLTTEKNRQVYLLHHYVKFQAIKPFQMNDPFEHLKQFIASHEPRCKQKTVQALKNELLVLLAKNQALVRQNAAATNATLQLSISDKPSDEHGSSPLMDNRRL